MQPQGQPIQPQDNSSQGNPLNYEFLDRLGLGSLSQQDKDSLLLNLRKALEIRVGEKLHAQLSEAQVKDFKRFIPEEGSATQPDPQAARQWLEQNAPGYRDVVTAELSALESEVGQQAPQILAEINGQAPAPTQPMQQPAPPVQPMNHQQQHPPQPPQPPQPPVGPNVGHQPQPPVPPQV